MNTFLFTYLALENVCLKDDCITCTAITCDYGNKPMLCSYVIKFLSIYDTVYVLLEVADDDLVDR